MSSPLPVLGSSRHPNAWLARLYTAGHGMAFGRPMCCECDAHAQLSQAFGLVKAIQVAEVAALDRGGILPPLPEPGCVSFSGLAAARSGPMGLAIASFVARQALH